MYKVRDACKEDKELLIKYKLSTIYEYAFDITDEEKERIKQYVYDSIEKEIVKYKIVLVDEEVAGAYLVVDDETGKMLDEIYIEEEYRGQGIGKSILEDIISKSNVVTLRVYKKNERAIKLYKSLGFEVEKSTETRYFMKWIRRDG